jgi:hypothetical protein
VKSGTNMKMSKRDTKFIPQIPDATTLIIGVLPLPPAAERLVMGDVLLLVYFDG